MRFRIEIDLEACVGSGMCVMTAPLVFDQDGDDGRVVLLPGDHDPSWVSLIEEAVLLCPTGALALVPIEDLAPGG